MHIHRVTHTNGLEVNVRKVIWPWITKKLFFLCICMQTWCFPGHLMENINAGKALHRAFSVFLFNKNHELLLQVLVYIVFHFRCCVIRGKMIWGSSPLQEFLQFFHKCHLVHLFPWITNIVKRRNKEGKNQLTNL